MGSLAEGMDVERPKMASSLSVQLLGKFKVMEKVVMESSGPVVSLTDCQLTTGLLEKSPFASAFRGASSSRRIRNPKLDTGLSSTTWCTVCFKSFQENDSRDFGDSPETLIKFMEIALSTKGKCKDLPATLTSAKCQSLSFCVNCHSAIKYLVATFQQIKELEMLVFEMGKKFQNVITLSNNIAEKENFHQKTGDIPEVRTLFREAIVNSRKLGSQHTTVQVNVRHANPDVLSVDTCDDADNMPLLSPAMSSSDVSLLNDDNEHKNEGIDNVGQLKVELEDNCFEGIDNDQSDSNWDPGTLQSDVASVTQDEVKSRSKEMKKRLQNSSLKNIGNIKGTRNPRSFNNLPPERLSQTKEAIRWRQLRAEHPEMSQRELKAWRKKHNTRSGTRSKGLNNPRSCKNIPPEKLSQTKSAKRWRQLRANHPEMSQRELTEWRRQYDEKRKPRCISTEDGRIFYKDIEIKKREDGTYVCSKCEHWSKGSIRRQLVMNHINRYHAPRSLKCSKCEKTFHQRNVLEDHVRLCQRKEKLVCDLCGATFNQNPSRLLHIRVVHKGIKPHTCEHCGKAFGRLKDLNIHVRRHTGERPFVCHVCGDSFIEKQSMKKHIRNTHPEVTEDVSADKPRSKVNISAEEDTGKNELGNHKIAPTSQEIYSQNEACSNE